MSMRLAAPALLCLTLVGCSMTPVVQSDLRGRLHAVTADSVQAGRDKAVEFCRQHHDQHAWMRGEKVVDHGHRRSYTLDFTCGGYNPEMHHGG